MAMASMIAEARVPTIADMASRSRSWTSPTTSARTLVARPIASAAPEAVRRALIVSWFAARYAVAVAPTCSPMRFFSSPSRASAHSPTAWATLDHVAASARTLSASPRNSSIHDFRGPKWSISHPAPHAIRVPRGSTPTPTASATNDTDDSPVSSHDPSDNPWQMPQMSSTTPDPDTADRDSSRTTTRGFDEDDEEEGEPPAPAPVLGRVSRASAPLTAPPRCASGRRRWSPRWPA